MFPILLKFKKRLFGRSIYKTKAITQLTEDINKYIRQKIENIEDEYEELKVEILVYIFKE